MLNFTGYDSDALYRLKELLIRLSICLERTPILLNATSCEEQDPSDIGAISHLNYLRNQTNVVNPASCINALAKIIQLAQVSKSLD